MFRDYETNAKFVLLKVWRMEQNVFHVVFTDDAVAFMNTIPQSAADKM